LLARYPARVVENASVAMTRSWASTTAATCRSLWVSTPPITIGDVAVSVMACWSFLLDDNNGLLPSAEPDTWTRQ